MRRDGPAADSPVALAARRDARLADARRSDSPVALADARRSDSPVALAARRDARLADARRSAVTLTQRGWTLLGASIGLVIGSRALGSDALAVPGLAGLLVLGLALLVARRSSIGFDVSRTVEPARPQVGDRATVRLGVTLTHGGFPGLVELSEPVPDGRVLRLAVGRLSRGEPETVTYAVATTQRGLHRLGPVSVALADPLGLASRTFAAGPETDLVVRPRVDVVRVGPLSGSPRFGAYAGRAAGVPAAASGELATLRLYEQGDDLRRVHWRTTARLDELVVRQDEASPWEQVTVVLDTRAAAHDEASFEAAVSACASLVVALHRARRPFVARTTGGLELGRSATGGLDAALDRLATAQTDAVIQPDATVWAAPSVIALTGSRDPAFARLVAGPRPRNAVLVTTRVDETGPGVAAPWVRVVDAGRVPFADAWNRGVPRWRSTAS